MLQEIIDIICEYVEADPDAITPEASLRNDIGATSFDLMNIAQAIEEQYSVKMPNSMIPKIKTVGDILSLLENGKA